MKVERDGSGDAERELGDEVEAAKRMAEACASTRVRPISILRFWISEGLTLADS